MTKQVWLIGGTTESGLIAKSLAAARLSHLITVATSTAVALYSSDSQVRVGRMDTAAMKQFCLQKDIALVVDASHPYAVAVSQQAIALAQALNLPYLRYERSSIQLPVTQSKSVIELNSFETLLQGDYLQEKRVLLTVGCKALPFFTSWQQSSTLFARILPKIESLQVAIAAGFTSDRIIALRPPICAELEKALWQQWQISLVVTKASGQAGGEEVKRQVAAELNIPLIVIARPKMVYPQQTSQIDRVVSFCRQHLET